MANAVNTNLWKQYNGKGFAAEYAEYAERANKDVDGNAIVDTYATKSEVSEAISDAHTHRNKAILDEIPVRSGTDSAMLYSADDSSDIAWKNWSYVTVSKKTTNSVLIGKNWYPYVKIGSNYWITENLREPIGTKNTDYWIYNENTVIERGYIYKHDAVIKGVTGVESDTLLALLHDGWHIPTENDAYDLLGAAGPYWESKGYEFMAVDADSITPYAGTMTCTDAYGFHAYPSGWYTALGGAQPGFSGYDQYATFYTKTDAGAAGQVKNFGVFFFDGTRSASIGSGIGGTTYRYCCVRLCKSAT